MKKLISVFAVSMILAGCGGGDGGSSGVPEARPSGTVSGTAFDGLIINGDVNVYEWSGSKGKLLGSGATDSLGEYSVQLDQVPSQPVLIEVTGGRYEEEASGKNVALRDGDFLYALKNYQQGDSISTSLTFYTTIAVGLAEHMTRTGADANEAIAKANDTVSDMIGIDIQNVVPLEVVDKSNATPVVTDQHLYGFATASISQLTAWISEQNNDDIHKEYNSIKLAAAAYQDIASDGQLDGKDQGRIIAQGTVRLTSDVYRSDIARNMLVMANSAVNVTGLTPTDILPMAEQYNQSNAALFAGAEIVPLEAFAPTVANFSHSNDDVIAGVVEISADVTDTVGLEEVSLYIDGTLHEFLGADPSPVFTVDTSALSEGAHEFELYTKNITGGETTQTMNLVVSNAGTTISDVFPNDQSILTGLQTFSAKVADPIGLKSVRFILDNAAIYEIDNVTSPSREFKINLLEEGVHTLTVEATNSVGTVATETVSFVVDNTNPTATWNLESGMSIADTFTLNVDADDNEQLSVASLFIDGDPIKEFLAFPIEYEFDTRDYQEGGRVAVLEVIDAAGNTVTLTKDLLFDNTQPLVEFLNVGAGSAFVNDFTLRIRVDENIGLESLNLLINGEIYKELSVDSNGYALTEIPVSNESNGQYALRVIARDRSGLVGDSETVVGFYPEPPEVSSKVSQEVLSTYPDDWLARTTITFTIENWNEYTTYQLAGYGSAKTIEPGVIQITSPVCELNFYESPAKFVVRDSRGLETDAVVSSNGAVICNNFE
jgi:hypothetical protein